MQAEHQGERDAEHEELDRGDYHAGAQRKRRFGEQVGREARRLDKLQRLQLTAGRLQVAGGTAWLWARATLRTSLMFSMTHARRIQRLAVTASLDNDAVDVTAITTGDRTDVQENKSRVSRWAGLQGQVVQRRERG